MKAKKIAVSTNGNLQNNDNNNNNNNNNVSSVFSVEAPTGDTLQKINSNQIKGLFLRRGERPSNWRKTSCSEIETLHVTSGKSENQTWATLVVVECSLHSTPSLSLLPW